ncbi:TonB-dependent siderophore receptor [Sporomusa termitida]|uniref:Ferrichrome outer membrane transporter/phage receptor n=1 Tax=Sporomusa termitida TaxID=2377 RepID=A0A517DQ90_9FIRM|nr:TonB-dependent siderophore receptor [Sporomusa termitida]QDR79512.1 Ferrichrome outer membrane transporter/phage receptor [Sporomusa termitida]
MKKPLFSAGQRLLCALIGGSLLWQWPGAVPAAAAAAATQAGAEQSDPAAAEGKPPRNEFALAGIEVTASKETVGRGYVASRSTAGTKTDTPLSDTPQSISIITRRQMDSRSAVNLKQALEYNAGITPGTDSRWNGSMVRGFDVARRADGLQLVNSNFALWDFEVYGLEQAAVLRGPASTLYGSSAPGGMFDLVTKRPTAEQLREIQIQGGTDNYRSLALDLGGQVQGQDKLTFRLTGLTRDHDLPHDYSSFERSFIAPSLAWKLAGNTNITLQAHYLKDKLNGSDEYISIYHPGSTLFGHSGRLFLGEPGYSGYQREQYYYGYFLDHQVNDTFSLHQKFRYGKTSTAYNMLWWSLANDGRTVIRDGRLKVYDDTATSYQLDTYGESKWASGAVSHHAIFGIDYRHGNLKNRSGYGGTMANIDIYDVNYSHAWTLPATAPDYQGKVIQTGIYAQDQISFGPKWTATLNGRQDWYEQNGINPQTGAKTRIDQSAFTGRAGLVYHATGELSPYLSYAESFEPQSGQDRLGNQFVPTTGRQYELGIHYEPHNLNARFTASLFDLRQQNVLTPDPVNTNFSIQTGEIAAKGLELEATMAAFKDLQLTASFTILNNKVTKDTQAANIGKRTAGVAKHTAALWLGTAGDQNRPGWNSGFGVRYIGSRENTGNTISLDNVWLADAAAGYNTGDWQYKLNIRNVFDTFHEIAGFNSTTTYQGEGRTFLLTATCRW